MERKTRKILPELATGWWIGISAPNRCLATLYSEFVVGYVMKMCFWYSFLLQVFFRKIRWWRWGWFCFPLLKHGCSSFHSIPETRVSCESPPPWFTLSWRNCPKPQGVFQTSWTWYNHVFLPWNIGGYTWYTTDYTWLYMVQCRFIDFPAFALSINQFSKNACSDWLWSRKFGFIDLWGSKQRSGT